jgi:hypothetical protein
MMNERSRLSSEGAMEHDDCESVWPGDGPLEGKQSWEDDPFEVGWLVPVEDDVDVWQEHEDL